MVVRSIKILLAVMKWLGVLNPGGIMQKAGKSMVGYRSVGAGVACILMGVVCFVVCFFPDVQSVISQLVGTPLTYAHAVGLTTAGVWIVGNAGKLDRANAANAQISDSMKQLVEILGGDVGQVAKIIAATAAMEQGDKKNETQ